MQKNFPRNFKFVDTSLRLLRIECKGKMRFETIDLNYYPNLEEITYYLNGDSTNNNKYLRVPIIETINRHSNNFRVVKLNHA